MKRLVVPGRLERTFGCANLFGLLNQSCCSVAQNYFCNILHQIRQLESSSSCKLPVKSPSKLEQHSCQTVVSKSQDKKMPIKVLNVAEKNDAAKNIAELLSRGRHTRKEGFSKFNKIYQFPYEVQRQSCDMYMTSGKYNKQIRELLDFNGLMLMLYYYFHYNIIMYDIRFSFWPSFKL